MLGGADADHELLGDLAIRQATRDEGQHLRLALRQPEALPLLRDNVRDAPLAARVHGVPEQHHWKISVVQSPPCSRISCARAGPSGRSWKSTKKSGSTAIEPSSPMSTLSRYERSSG